MEPPIRIINPRILFASETLADPYADGAGTELARILERFWITPKEGCGCGTQKQTMNSLGIEWCEQNKNVILNWLKLEAGKRGLPFLEWAARKLIDRAIANARGRKMDTTHLKVEPVIFRSPVKRNFLMHLWPVKGYGAWQWNCDQIKKRADLFNGRRVIAIAVSPETDKAEEVMEYLDDFTDEYFVVENNPQLREVITFRHLLKQVESDDLNEVTFCCHGKCVRHSVQIDEVNSTIFRWTKAMYETCLDYWPLVEQQLRHYAMTGSFKRYGQFTTRNNHRWHYSGTFYWFRNRDVFARDWQTIDTRFFGTESWPGRMFLPEETGCLFMDNVQDLYNLEYWNDTIEPGLRIWKKAQELLHSTTV